LFGAIVVFVVFETQSGKLFNQKGVVGVEVKNFHKKWKMINKYNQSEGDLTPLSFGIKNKPHRFFSRWLSGL